MSTSTPLAATALTVAMWLAPVPARAQGEVGQTLTLEEALEIATANSPVLMAATARVEEASGGLTQAAVLLLENPAITVSRGRRSALSGSTSFEPEFEVGLEQQLEIGGQRGKRMGMATAEVEVARAEATDTRRIVELAVAQSFFEGLAAAERTRLADENEQVASRLLDLARRRLSAGAGTPLEVNAATIRLAEARRLRLSAITEQQVAFLTLRSHLGVDLADDTALRGELPSTAPTAVEAAVLSRALLRRPDLLAEGGRVEAAGASDRLAGAEGWPDVSLTASLAQEEGTQLLSAGVRIPLALFNRNQGGRAAATAAYERANAEREAKSLEVAADARAAVTLYEQARSAAELYDTQVLAAMEESAALMQLAVESGELGVADVLVVQAELLSGQVGYVDARLDLATAGARIRAAVGAFQSVALEEVVR